MELTFRNPFKVSLSLLNLLLLWKFTPDAVAPSEEKLPQQVTNEESLAQKVRGQKKMIRSQGLWRTTFKKVKVIFCSYLLQSLQEQSDTISTQVILEFHLGPEETKTVQWFLNTAYTVMDWYIVSEYSVVTLC